MGTAEPSSARGGAEALPRLVGRTRELGRLEALFDAADGGTGGVILVHGEAGIGKSRLLLEARVLASERGFRVAHGQCQERDRGTPYAPWAEMLGELLRGTPKSLLYRAFAPRRAAVLRLLPELGHRVWLYEPREGEGESLDRRRFLGDLADAFAAVAQDRPLLVLLDDLGWADSGTLELVDHLARTSGARRLAIVAAYRDAHLEESPPLDRFADSLARDRLAGDLVPGALSIAEIGELIQSACEGRKVSEVFRHAVWRQSGGNPFFATEMLRALADEGTLFRAIDATSPSRLATPPSIRGVISQRLARLDEESRRTLRVASLLGLEFRVDLLEAVSQSAEEPLLNALDRALQLRLVTAATGQAGGTTYCFAHPLIQDVLASEVGPERRRRIHLRAARTLEARGDDGGEGSGSLAYHYLLAEEWRPALTHSIRAARWAVSLFAAADAVAHFRNALTLFEEHPEPREAAQALEEMSAQLAILGDYAGAVNALARASALQAQLGDRTRSGSLMTQAALYGAFTPREFRRIEERLRDARRVLESAPPSVQLAQLYLDHATFMFKRVRLDEARDLLALALTVAQALGNRSIEAAVYLTRAQIVPIGSRTEVLRELGRALDVSREIDPDVALRAFHLLGLVAAYGHADLSTAEAWVRQGEEYAARHDRPDMAALLRGGVGSMVAFLRGDLAGAQRGSEEFRESLRRRGQPASGHNMMVLALVADARGDHEEAARCIAAARTTFSEEEGWFQDLWLLLFRGMLELSVGRFSDADAALRWGLAALRRRGLLEVDAALGVLMLAHLVESGVRVGEVGRAQSDLDELLRLAGVVGGDLATAHVLRAEATIAYATGNVREAADRSGRAAAAWQAVGCELERARDLGRSGAALIELGDRGLGEARLQEAGGICRSAGARIDLSLPRPLTPGPLGASRSGLPGVAAASDGALDPRSTHRQRTPHRNP
ncbi:MAG TPA: AAA family ATPase [Thermoplasmata archaeon]|nr:AAA family ATPase [Thermoplasmata archaeon]